MVRAGEVLGLSHSRTYALAQAHALLVTRNMATFSLDLDKRAHRDAARLAIQSAVAAAAMFALMKALDMPERFVGVLSAVMVVQPSAGAAISEAKDRFFATIIGAVIGVVCLTLLPAGYGTAAALALSMLVMNAIAGFRTEWRHGVVAAVALALGSEQDALQTALDRSLAIGVGVVLGALVAFVVWPDKAEDRTRRSLKEAWHALSDYLEQTVAKVTGEQTEDKGPIRHYRKPLTAAMRAVEDVSFADTGALKRQLTATRSVASMTQFLDRIGNEAEPARDGALRESVHRATEAASKVLRALAQDEVPPEAAFETLTEALQAAREAQSDIPDSERRDLTGSARGALAFTLGELDEALRELRDAVSQTKG